MCQLVIVLACVTLVVVSGLLTLAMVGWWQYCRWYATAAAVCLCGHWQLSQLLLTAHLWPGRGPESCTPPPTLHSSAQPRWPHHHRTSSSANFCKLENYSIHSRNEVLGSSAAVRALHCMTSGNQATTQHEIVLYYINLAL